MLSGGLALPLFPIPVFRKEVSMENEIKKQMGQTVDIAELTHELTYHKYLMNNGQQIGRFFKKLSIPEYLALHMIEEAGQESSIYSGRTYLKDIADKMQRTIREISKMIKALQERGLVVWSHDGDGAEGTYVTITESGRNLLDEEKEILRGFYGRVIQSYGRDNLIRLLQLMKQLETTMSAELESLQAPVVEENETS